MLRFPGIPALSAPIHRLAASGEAPDEAVATGAGGDGGRATTGTGKGLVFCKQVSRFNLPNGFTVIGVRLKDRIRGF